MNEIENYNNKIFEDIKHLDENGNEYWYARELQQALNYIQWRRFETIINKARHVCEKSNVEVLSNFASVGKIVKTGVSKKSITDYKLTRYACYLIVQNGDSRKKVISLGQTYFAVQTRKMEITEAKYSKLTEEEKRLYRRKQTKRGNKVLYKIASEKGVKNFDKFTNAGYKGLYNGETANDIAKRKNLRYRQDILDNMCSEELGANIFRITQTEALLEKQEEQSELVATKTHYKVGRAVRDTIKKIGGTMPERLTVPPKTIKDLAKVFVEEHKKTR